MTAQLIKFIQYILDLGPAIMMPIIMTLFGLILRQGFIKSLWCGIIIGISFVGIDMVIELLSSSVGPASQAMVERMGLDLNILDIGWPIAAKISFSSPVSVIVIPSILILNVIMLLTNLTKTLTVDIFNFFHVILTVLLVNQVVDNLTLSVFAGLVVYAIGLKIADWTAPVVEKFYGLKGVSMPQIEVINFAPLMYFIEKITNKIPYLNRMYLDPDVLKSRFGLIGDPLFMGFGLGVLIGVLAGYDLGGIVTLGVKMAGVLIILPKMVDLLMDGLLPLSEGARDIIQKKYPQKNIYIGLDVAVAVAKPAVIAVAILMVPISIILAFILPYNKVLPYADLSLFPFMMIWAVAAARGNIIRGLINGIISLFIVFFIATNLAPLYTSLAHSVGFRFPEGITSISGLDIGAHIIPWIVVHLMSPTTPGFYVALFCAVAYGAAWWWVRNDIKRQVEELEKTDARGK
jgi:PTS system galactitol-specific IIC component